MKRSLAAAVFALAAAAQADPPPRAAPTLAAVSAAMPERVRPAHGLTPWIDRDGERVFAVMLTCNNAEECVGWVRVDDAGAVLGGGNFGLEFPHRLSARDVDGDGRPELVVDGEYFTGESPGQAPRVEVWSFPRGASAPVRRRGRRQGRGGRR